MGNRLYHQTYSSEMRSASCQTVKHWLWHPRMPRCIAGSTLLCLVMLFGVYAPSFASSSEPALVSTEDPVSKQILGVGTHVGGQSIERDFSVIATIHSLNELGITSVRDELAWSSFLSNDPAQDQIHNAPLLSLLKALPGRPILGFGFGNAGLNQGRLPRGPDELSQYQLFIRRAYSLVKPFHPILEVWNEWNLGTGTATRDKGSAADYVALAKVTAEALSDEPTRPDLLVGSGGDDAIDWRWTMEIIRLGALRYGTGLAVHVYNHCLPMDERTAGNVIERLRDLRAKMTAAGVPADYPVYITETGWPTHSGSCGLSEQAAAVNMATLLTEVRHLSWIKGVWLYDLRDDGNRSDNQEDRFGLFNHAYEPKPAACDVAKLSGLFFQASAEQLSMTKSCQSPGTFPPMAAPSQ